MTGAPTLKAMDLGEEMSKIIRVPFPADKAQDEYQQLFQNVRQVYANLPFIDGRYHDLVYIESDEHPIYRFQGEDISVNIPTDFITRYQSNSGKKVLGQGETAVFILLHYSSFCGKKTFEQAEKLLQIWSNKMEDGLDAFAHNRSRKTPKVRVKLYKTLEDINHNPMKYYDLNYGSKGDELALPIYPTMFVDCSPPNIQKSYAGQGLEMNFGEIGVPDFSLFFTILSANNREVSDLLELSKNIGSGFNIIQDSSGKDEKVPVVHILNMCSVLCTRLLLSAPSQDEKEHEPYLIESCIKESFNSSKKVPYSKSSGLYLIDQPDLHRGVIDNSSIKWLSNGWRPTGLNTMLYDAIKFYDKELHNCSNGSSNLLRAALEVMMGHWKRLTHHFLPTDFVHPSRPKVNSRNDIIVDQHYTNGVINHIDNMDEVNRAILDSGLTSIGSDFTNDEFQQLYKSFSEIIDFITNHKLPRRDGISKKKWRSLWDNCQSISHSTIKHRNSLSDLEILGVKLKLISRILIYDTLRVCLSKIRADLGSTRAKNGKVYFALCQLIGLQPDGGYNND